MSADVDLRKLSEMTGPDRAFLTVCIAGPRSVAGLDKEFKRARRLLTGGGDAEKDEREHFDENVALVRDYLDRNAFESGGLCIFACWALDFFLAVPVPVAFRDLVWVDSSPFIRPLAELQDEYENVAVVVADNTRARIYCVSSGVAGDAEAVKGNVKNHVKKGGWSQQRYERRRDKQLLLYAREIVDALKTLDREEDFRFVLLVGGSEITRIVRENLPASLGARVAEKAVDLGKGEAAVNRDVRELFETLERESERDLWERIRTSALQGGRGCVGIADVLAAAREGRVDTMVVDRTLRPEGTRCRDCQTLDVQAGESCPECGSASVFRVDLVNEIVEMLKQTGAETDFADPVETLTESGRIGALLRY